MKQTFTEAIGGVSALDGAIDGAARTKPRKAPAKSGRRENPEATSGRLCPICREPFFEFEAFARHVWDEVPSYTAELEAEVSTWREIREFRKVARLLMRVAPDSAEAVRLAGGISIHEATDDDCREAAAAARWREGSLDEVPLQTLLLADEYIERARTGRLKALTPEEFAERAQLREGRIRARADAILPPPSERRLRRIALNLTMGQLAEKMGVQDQTVRRWEAGRSIPLNTESVRAYAELLATASLDAPLSAEQSDRRRRADSRRMAWPSGRVRDLRMRLGLSRPEFAARLGSGVSTIYAWERGSKGLSDDAIRRLRALAESESGEGERRAPEVMSCARQDCGNDFPRDPGHPNKIYCSRRCNIIMSNRRSRGGRAA